MRFAVLNGESVERGSNRADVLEKHMSHSNEETLRKDSKPAAEVVKEVKLDPAALDKARKFRFRSEEGGKAEENAVAGKE